MYAVEIRCDRQHLARAMSDIREWLDAQRIEADAFRCATAEASVIFRLEFRSESQALTCAGAFEGRLVSGGDKSGA